MVNVYEYGILIKLLGFCILAIVLFLFKTRKISDTGFCLRLRLNLLSWAQSTELGHKICWDEAKVLQTEPSSTYKKKKGIHPRVSGRSSDQITQLGHLSQLDSHYRSGSQKATAPSSVDVSGRSSDQSTRLGHLSHLDSPIIAAEVIKLQLRPIDHE
jgi:hypothetical protein